MKEPCVENGKKPWDSGILGFWDSSQGLGRPTACLEINKHIIIPASVINNSDMKRFLIQTSCSSTNNSDVKKLKKEVGRKMPKCPSTEQILNWNKNDQNTSCKHAGMILAHKNKIFLVQPTGQKGYGIPKGAIDENETEIQAAWREMYEETGIELELTNLNDEKNVDQNNNKAYIIYLKGSRDVKGKGAKKIAAFIVNSIDGNENYICSNVSVYTVPLRV